MQQVSYLNCKKLFKVVLIPWDSGQVLDHKIAMSQFHLQGLSCPLSSDVHLTQVGRE